MAVVVLLSDFGLEDPYVGLMHCVLAGISPEARVVDFCHSVPAQDVEGGAWLLGSAVDYVPQDAIVVGVVDPGVGSTRRSILVRTDKVFLVGPDNGLFTKWYEFDPPKEAWVLENAEFHLDRVSATFHGRDIFAPVAGWLAEGKDPKFFGPKVSLKSLERLDLPRMRVFSDKVEGQILYSDSFGNLVTNIERGKVPADARGPVRVCGRELPLVRTFADVSKGAVLAYFGSMGLLEIARRQGSAADLLAARRGNRVQLFFGEAS
ncbi:MAG TPA: hypothetical protein ENK02_15680 [Planctomycetes bacterium]|nr:hypothetical protein [Planctomycetota bacterium]